MGYPGWETQGTWWRDLRESVLHVDSVVSPVYWQGYLIIKLKRYCEQLAELTQAEADTLGPVIQVTCSALMDVLRPAKVYVCSFGDGIKHIHFWVLPRP